MTTSKANLPGLLPFHSILVAKIISSFYFHCSTENYSELEHVPSYLTGNMDLLAKGSHAALFSMLFFMAASHQGQCSTVLLPFPACPSLQGQGGQWKGLLIKVLESFQFTLEEHVFNPTANCQESPFTCETEHFLS